MPRKTIPLTLIHNDSAGDADHGRSALVALCSRAGYTVDYVRYDRKTIGAVLERAGALIAVAGGDGTIARVAALARPHGPPIAILPLGTANNIACALDIGPPSVELVASWRTATIRPFYPIDSDGPWGPRRLIEGIGFGAIGEAIAALPDKIDHGAARQRYAAAVISSTAEFLELRLGGETINERFAVLEISTIPFIGPNLRLVAAADPEDRRFAICFIRDRIDERRALARWIADDGDGAPPVSIRMAMHATISGRFRRVRIDGGVKATTPERDWNYAQPITLTTAAEPLPFLRSAS